jgi:hypothetical protein
MHSSYQGGDPADYPQASIGFDYDSIDDRTEPAYIESERMSPAQALIRVIDFIQKSENYRLAVDVIVAGSGLALCQGWSYTELARRHDISKQAFDKHVLKFQKDFNLPVTRAQKSPQARLSYKKHQLDRVERLKKTNAATKERAELVWQNSQGKAPRVP